MRRVVLPRLHAVPLVDPGHLVRLVAVELHADQLRVVVHLSAQSPDLVLKVLTHFLLLHQPLGVVTDLTSVEGGRDGAALGQVVDGGGRHRGRLCVGVVQLWVGAVGLHLREEVSLAVVVEHLVRSQDGLLLLCLGQLRAW